MARDPQNLHGPALLSHCPQDAPQLPQPSLFALARDSLSVTRAKAPVSSRRVSYFSASFATTVSASKGLYLAAAVAAHEHSCSILFSTTTPAPPSACSQNALASKIHPYYFYCFRLGVPAASPPRLQNILAPVPPAFLIRPLHHLPLGNLSPVVSPGSPLHLSYRHRAVASCLSATVSSPASCRTASVGVLLSIPDIILADLSWVRSSLYLLVLEIQGLHTGAAYSSKLP